MVVKVWRFNVKHCTVEREEVSEYTQLDCWLLSSVNEGWYFYSENLETIKTVARKNVLRKVDNLQKILEGIENIQEY